MRVLAYCLMPNDWHFVLWPEQDGELTAFASWLPDTHFIRWHPHYHATARAAFTRVGAIHFRTRRLSFFVRCCAFWNSKNRLEKMPRETVTSRERERAVLLFHSLTVAAREQF